MRRLFIVLAAMVLVTSGAGLANAALWTDTWNPADVKINFLGSYSYQHDIRDNGFDPFQDLVTNFNLQVFLKDDGDVARESASIWFPLLGGGSYNFSYTSTTYGWSLGGLAELNLLGLLDVKVTSWGGDFYFDKSILTAEGCETAVPEPSTLLLLGGGLMGLVGYGRRMVKK